MTIAVLLAVIAIICFALAALGAFGVIAGINVGGFGYLGLAFLAGAHIA